MAAGARVYRAGMTTKLAKVKQELNTTLFMVIKKDGAIGRLSEQLQSKCRNLTLSHLVRGSIVTCHFVHLSDVKIELE
jgi:hypothetical protein